MISYLENYSLIPWFLDFIGKVWRMSCPLFLTSTILVLISEIIMPEKPEPFDKEADLWHPDNNKMTKPQKLVAILKTDFLEDNNNEALTILQNSIADFKSQKTHMQLIKDKWHDLPALSDKEFREQYNGSGERRKVYNRVEVAKIIETYAHRIYLIDMEIKKCNDFYNKLFLKAPKQKGFTKPKDIDSIDGMRSISLDDLE